ncbi:DEAD/DEAH box helicase [Hoeflea alexandrii]|uniref:DEAD/DEAH box helicase family protein n=1 Tax=Hoeflea alexandrii TaxID=288436 RepID=A0ABT1CMA0_9HYPH|nr:DEAD/DEAH box helicase [Hoeflea alexandrii]MCO6407336.1 DEAD/DEAH box helicase family protein [Hoeflea alexandrii]
MGFELRYYQNEAIKSIIDYWDAGGGNPLIEMATGVGKSMVLAGLTKKLLEDYPAMRILMVVHRKKLIRQNFGALLKAWPDAPVGIYSAGLGKRDAHHRITFAGIQSVYNKVRQLGPRDVILIDECHLVPAKGEGQYRQLLDDMHAIAPHARVCGFTATPYRTDTGRLDAGSSRLFDETIYKYDIGKGIADGYLAPLVSRAGIDEIDVSNVRRAGGEFVGTELEKVSFDIIDKAVAEICEIGKTRKSWLIFCPGIKHSEAVCAALKARGIICGTVHSGNAEGLNDSNLERFEKGEIRALASADMITTGFDAPGVDLIAMLRATLSVSLYVQIAGRGTRVVWPHGFDQNKGDAEDRINAIARSPKPNCLVLDYAGNIRRHGPVDAVGAESKTFNPESDTGKVSVDSVRAKECPGCQELIAINSITCKICGHEFPREEKPKHEAEAEKSVGILSGEKVPPQQIPVVDWRLDRHTKAYSPDSVRVTYIAGISEYREWLAFEHGGYASQKAMQWWAMHGGSSPYPKTTDEALHRMEELTMPVTISVKPNKKYFDIVGRSFPARRELEAAE